MKAVVTPPREVTVPRDPFLEDALAQFRKQKALADGALAQVPDAQ